MANPWVFQIQARGFWFVDIPRTSSSSIKVELGRRYGLPYGKSNLIDHEYSTRQGIGDHIPARFMRQYLSDKSWENIFTFTLVRNPWDRQVSMYFYRLRKGHFTEKLGFRDYILRLQDAFAGNKVELFSYHAFYLGCCDYILDEQNKVMVSFVGRYENRERDIRTIGERIGYPELGKLFIQTGARDKAHYSHYYNDETREIIATLYRNDISIFGYEFESPRSI